ncbi:MerR family transcriptional regulator [Bogoriella caseilytica]|uniref:DNA-binding transcriptional MerR regulator n=1 Tax=Bogoriella caseilytica TaxID=56055 RepID=A0A3N2BDA9_9MICO|nr:MerR family transcriptional regulator [Bogoriella caseilytica]ROR73239.1 DNA-binding transcriptional MerR regulator [Bogoriella caseilytica]
MARDGAGDLALLSIGELARASGLSISALRFYDRQGLLRPAEVSAHSGYRWYAAAQIEEAQLLAALRTLGLPLAEMAAVLARPGESASLLAAHLDRLEEELTGAREQVSSIGRRWGATRTGAGGAAGGNNRRTPDSGEPTTLLVTASALADGLRTVRHAVGDDPDMPAIHGVLLVAITGALRLAATDRTRAAFAEVPGAVTGRFRALLPTAAVDALVARLADMRGQAELLLRWRKPRLSMRAGIETVLEEDLPEAAFPDLSHAIPKARQSAMVDGAALARALATTPEVQTWWLAPGGALTPAGSAVPEDAALVNRDYLADALQALEEQAVRLDFDGPAQPLALRRAEDPGSFSVLLPITPEEREGRH